MLLPALDAYGAGADFRCVVVWDNGMLGALVPDAPRAAASAACRCARCARGATATCCHLHAADPRQEQSRREVRRRAAGERRRAARRVRWRLRAGGPVLRRAGRAASDGRLAVDGDRRLCARAAPARARPARALQLEHEEQPAAHGRRACAAVGNAHRRCASRRATTWHHGPRNSCAWRRAAGRASAGSALACREEERRYAAAVFPEAFRRGRLHITGLDLDGRPLARHVHLTAGESCFTFKIAYDEAHEKSSPGILAEVDNVRQFMETPGRRWIDSNTSRARPHLRPRVEGPPHVPARRARPARRGTRRASPRCRWLRIAKRGLQALARPAKNKRARPLAAPPVLPCCFQAAIAMTTRCLAPAIAGAINRVSARARSLCSTTPTPDP